MFLLDTDTCIDVLRGVNTVVQRLRRLSPDDCSVSAISAFELYAGVHLVRHPEREKRRVDDFLDVVTVVAFDRVTGQEAARLRAELRSAGRPIGPYELRSAGRPIGPYDLLIAAQAIRSNYILVSANVREFSRIESLRLESWR